MENNKDLRTEYTDIFCVIVADRDGVRKYISNNYPRTFQYTIQLNKAKKFYSEEYANKFIKGFDDCDRFVIDNPEIKTVQKHLTLL